MRSQSYEDDGLDNNRRYIPIQDSIDREADKVVLFEGGRFADDLVEKLQHQLVITDLEQTLGSTSVQRQ